MWMETAWAREDEGGNKLMKKKRKGEDNDINSDVDETNISKRCWRNQKDENRRSN